MKTHPVDAWFIARSISQTDNLDKLLSDDVAFFSPHYDPPQVGKNAAKLHITGITKLLTEGEHRYVRQIVGAQDAMLEFELIIDGLKINGVEILKWNTDLKITEIKVMLRPLTVANIARERMQQLLLSKKLAK